MHYVRQESLPFVGSSHEFIGAEQGGTNVSVFLFHGQPGSGPGPHRHPYDEIQFIREGRGVWTVNGNTFEGKAGDIFVIKSWRRPHFQGPRRFAAYPSRRPLEPAFHPGKYL